MLPSNTVILGVRIMEAPTSDSNLHPYLSPINCYITISNDCARNERRSERYSLPWKSIFRLTEY